MKHIPKILRTLWPIWIGLWTTLFTMVAGVTFFFGYAGLALTEKNNPHVFDHSGWVSFGLLNNIMFLGSIIFIITLVMVVLLVSLWPVNKVTERSSG